MWLWLLVQLNGKGERVIQTLSAVLGCSVLFGTALALLVPIVLMFPEGALALLGVLAVWAIIFWSIAVDGHILAVTLNLPRAFGFAVAAAVFVFQYYLMGLLSAAAAATS